MGALSWLISGAAAAGVGRFIRQERRSLALEAGSAIAASLASGLAATALDFGGWSTFDPRAATLAALAAIGAIGLVRAVTSRGSS